MCTSGTPQSVGMFWKRSCITVLPPYKNIRRLKYGSKLNRSSSSVTVDAHAGQTNPYDSRNLGHRRFGEQPTAHRAKEVRLSKRQNGKPGHRSLVLFVGAKQQRELKTESTCGNISNHTFARISSPILHCPPFAHAEITPL